MQLAESIGQLQSSSPFRTDYLLPLFVSLIIFPSSLDIFHCRPNLPGQIIIYTSVQLLHAFKMHSSSNLWSASWTWRWGHRHATFCMLTVSYSFWCLGIHKTKGLKSKKTSWKHVYHIAADKLHYTNPSDWFCTDQWSLLLKSPSNNTIQLYSGWKTVPCTWSWALTGMYAYLCTVYIHIDINFYLWMCVLCNLTWQQKCSSST